MICLLSLSFAGFRQASQMGALQGEMETSRRHFVTGLLRLHSRLPPCDGELCSMEELEHYLELLLRPVKMRKRCSTTGEASVVSAIGLATQCRCVSSCSVFSCSCVSIVFAFVYWASSV